MNLFPARRATGARASDRRRKPTRTIRPTLDGMEERILMTALPRGFSQSVVASGLLKPTGLVVAPDGRIFVTQKSGEVRVIKGGKLLPQPVVTVTTQNLVERGLVGITLDPNFSRNHYLYLFYTVPGSPAHSRVSRFTLSGNLAVPGSEVPLLDLPGLDSEHHNGGSLQFGLDGKLYVGVGDNENKAAPQSLDSPLGKILRINADGSIPQDNPFYNQTTRINRAIWALGLRNPYSTSVQPGTGHFYINDVGESTFEKIDRGIAGANYGWPVTENATGDPRFQAPLYVYTHGPNESNGAAIVGGAFYNPSRPRFPKSFVGNYFFEDIIGYIKTYNPATGAVKSFATGLPPVPDSLAVDPNGSLYFLSIGTKNNSGQLLKISYH